MSAPTFWRVKRLCDREAVQRGNALMWREAARDARESGDRSRAEHYERLAWSAEGRARRLRRRALRAR